MSESAPTTTTFDYQALESELRLFVQQKADETHGLLKRTTEHILRIGQNLKAVKEKLPHGQFLPWIETEFGMSRWTAQNFIRVAERLEGKWGNFHHLPISVLYEVAAPSTSEEILTQVGEGQLAPTLAAVKAAKEAERMVREEVEQTHAQRALLGEELQSKQLQIEELSQHITQLQERIATLAAAPVEVREVEKPVVPPETQARVEQMHQRIAALTQERDALRQRVAQLGEEARAAAQKQSEGGQERRVRLSWYKATNEFQASVSKILAQWPSPLDTQAFEADDWTRLSQTKEVVRRFLEACTALTQARVVEGSTVSAQKEE